MNKSTVAALKKTRWDSGSEIKTSGSAMSRLVSGVLGSRTSSAESRGWCRNQGVPRGIRIGLLVLAALVMASNVMAQHTPDPGKTHGEGERPFEIFGGYSYLREDGLSLNGWTGTFIAKVNRWFAIAADFDGHYGTDREGLEDVRVRVHGFTFGPHVALHNRSRVLPFAFALFGGAHESVKVEGLKESATGFAANLGGGLDVHVNESVSVRLIQVDAAYTRFEGHGTTSPRFSTGLVFHFGKPR